MIDLFKDIFYQKKLEHYLFTTYYTPNCEKRKAEYDFCIEKNKAALFDKIFLFVEEKDMYAASKFGVNIILTKSRPTFKDYFEYIITNNYNDSINIIANTDIFFLNMNQIDRNIRRLKKGKCCFALSRYDFEPGKPSYLFDRSDSQDTWVFNGCEGIENIKFVDFPMGIPGCDNRLAYELNQAGFKVLNPSKIIHSFHLHNVPIRTYLNDSSAKVPPPYFMLPPTK